MAALILTHKKPLLIIKGRRRSSCKLQFQFFVFAAMNVSAFMILENCTLICRGSGSGSNLQKWKLYAEGGESLYYKGVEAADS